jgi:hypothetical protein
MSQRLWFDLTTVLHLAETAAAAHRRVDLDGNLVPDAPPALDLMRDRGGDLDDRLHIGGNAHPGLTALDVGAEPFRRTWPSGRFDHGITWTEWLGAPLRPRSAIQAPIGLPDDSRLLDLLRAGHTAGFDMFTIDADADAAMRPGVARRRRRSRRPRPASRAGASFEARPADGPPYTSSRERISR